MTAVVFDIGNVLVRWDPVPAFLPDLNDRDEVLHFLERTDFHALNLRADRGERFGTLAQEISDPDDRMLLARYTDRFALTVRDAIEDSWKLLERLRRRGYGIHAITNWSAETWPIGLTLHPRLHDVFGVTIVSGRVGLVKPEAAIFDLFCARAGVGPENCLLVDDSPANIAGAQAAGWQTHLFETPVKLDADLTERGLL
ncbi:HAD family hydrolase [Roseovarius sp. SYSU LYC5161]|uniref:HAD family hydrolase n=1 Tax=Roseovarius halophilus (ex Wu et al. 2025) TaxID=3376060 RepID=UPI00399C4579